MKDRIQLEEGWKELLLDQFQLPYMVDLRQFLVAEKSSEKTIYPPASLWFEALNKTPFDKVRVVIIGQDPYHNPHQAHGLCFSVRDNVPYPPSLRNIFAEISTDILAGPKSAFQPPGGNLTTWSEQGVLLLNAVLTVEQGKAGSHQGRGWEEFTDRIIFLLGKKKQNLVFMLWGNYAQHKGAQIDRLRHLVLAAPHPSPLSAHRGFFGCRHFSQCNRYLSAHNQSEIDWLKVGQNVS